MKATLAFLEKLTLSPGEVGPADALALRRAGVSRQAAEDAIVICALFNLVDRVADALDFEVPPQPVLDRGAELLLRWGYGG